MANAGCVLVVDDDASIREMLSDYLSSEGYRVALAEDGAAMRREIERAAPDLVLLDLKLPREDGLSLARFLRERYDVGIIMVTGAGGVVDRIVGLEVGADDYLAKPFEPRELLARIKSLLRRMQSRPAGNGGDDVRRCVAFGTCRLDLASHQLIGGDGYQVSCQRHLIFGLGDAAKVDRLVVRWPSGREQMWTDLAFDQELRLVEGDAHTWTLPR